MISLPDFLRRFRRAWAPPGAALARVAPPVDVSARLRAEVQPLLDAIAEIQHRGDRLRGDADAKAAALLDAAKHDADHAVRDAEKQAPEARAAAAREAHRAVDAELSSIATAGSTEAERIGKQAKERAAELLDRVRACVLAGPEVDR